MNLNLLDFVQDVGAATTADDVGQRFVRFAQECNASVVHMFMETQLSGFRAGNVPYEILEEEVHDSQFGTSQIVELVTSGAPKVFWGVDIDQGNPMLPELDVRISEDRFRLLKQRNSVTFPMPDADGQYRGAGVGIGFEDRGETFLTHMAEACGSLALASFSAHSRIQLLLTHERAPSPLSKRQGEILELLAAGFQLGGIADRLGIADSTVNLHLAQLKKKLNVKTKEQALAMAISSGWISL
ncbi:LuxR family transcriptional regulator [Phaeobacter inhibens]|uniref:LuxR family transcriptional regulator n=1 Tax=Phaeobacter inhibens TaxID=221822 RepID=UPI0021A3C614|nr:LuxR family transcriptional regulator [Phaeobacter inhibens]UWR87830.1 helix-turn-helix transcriptional regulator [Phaeobacter inhibens]